MMLRLFTIWIMVFCQIQAQSTSFPLESVAVEGTAISKEIVLELAGLHIGAPVDKAAIEAASQKLSDTGLFESVNYNYASGPNRGYAVTLQAADPRAFSNASIDVAGVNEDEVWRWLAARYPTLNHKVPANGAAQTFVAGKIEEHLGSGVLEGHHLTAKLEADVMRRGGNSNISFQPDPLPRIATITFAGQSELTSEQLADLIPKDMREQGYTDRGFRQAVELNLRRAYEDRGMYRVGFPSIVARPGPGWTVSVATSIEEGAKYTLGDVQIDSKNALGDKLPMEAMLNAAKFRKGALANWTQIQNSIWELEKPVKRLGYFHAAAQTERVFQDNQHILDLKISMNLGPIHKFGQLLITGLPPDLEAQARKAWSFKPGDPFDYDYPRDFFQAFFHSVDSRQFKKYSVKLQPGAGDNVMDFALIFEPL